MHNFGIVKIDLELTREKAAKLGNRYGPSFVAVISSLRPKKKSLIALSPLKKKMGR